MKIVSPSIHGVLDYATAGTMIALPRVMGFSKPTTNLMTGAGTAIIGMSLLTRYPLGLLRVLPMPLHLMADGVLDALLIREGGRIGKKEPTAGNAIRGMAVAGTLLTLMTRSRQKS